MSWFTDNGFGTGPQGPQITSPVPPPLPISPVFDPNMPGTVRQPNTTPSAGALPTAAQITQAYQQYLGRTPSQSEIGIWLGNVNWLQGIATSPEASAYHAAHPTAGTVPGTPAFSPYTGNPLVIDPKTGLPTYAPQTPAPGGGPTGAPTSAPKITNPNDPAQIAAWLQWRATQPGADPILKTPGGIQYYQQAILSNGGLTDTNYWTNKSTLAQFGGAVGAPAGGGSMGGSPNVLAGLGMSGSLASTYPGGSFSIPPATLSSLPSWAQPYKEQFRAPSTNVESLPSWAQPYGKEYHLPTAEEARNTPGYQFAQSEGLGAIDKSAASRGSLLTGGTLREAEKYATGLADTYYQNRVNNSLADFGTNYGVFTGDQNRASGAYQQQFGNALAEFNTNAGKYYNNANLASGAYQNLFNNAMNAYGTNFNAWNTVGTNLFNRYNTLAQYGLSQ